MRKLKLLWILMKGRRLLYSAAIFSVGMATLMSVVVPLVVKTTIDSIIGNKAIEAASISLIINFLGGKNLLRNNLWICGIIIILLTLVNGLFLYLKGKWSSIAAESIAKNTREKLYDHLQRLPYDYHVKAQTGDLIQRCTSDVETIRSFLAVQFVEVGRTIFMVVFVSIIMFSLNLRLAFVSITAVPIIFIYAFIFFQKVQKAFLEVDESEGRLSTSIQENLTGMRVVRAFGKQSYEIKRFDEKNSEFRDLLYKLIKILAWYWSISDLICFVQIVSILVLGSYWTINGSITLGTLVVFLTYEGMLLWPVRQMGRILTDMGKSFVSATRIFEILDVPVEAMEENFLKPEIKGNIEFNNICFEYEEDKLVLKDISFKVEKGMTVAILGPTGSGKTSLVNLLPRLYDYKTGSIKIDGTELNMIDRKWIRRNIGIALQEPFLFSKTIMENIKLAKDEATEGDVYESSRIASIHDSIMEFDKGYETAVGEKGVTLSGGQKQRVTIARTIINNYPILIFDDSLSAVDTETDAEIRRALNRRSKEVTTFIISHRITTLSEADLILVLDKGKIVQSGKHEVLSKQEGLYKKIWEIQNSLERELEDDMQRANPSI
jgi:ATP-binding cassette, subfamily B, bacterial